MYALFLSTKNILHGKLKTLKLLTDLIYTTQDF